MRGSVRAKFACGTALLSVVSMLPLMRLQPTYPTDYFWDLKNFRPQFDKKGRRILYPDEQAHQHQIARSIAERWKHRAGSHQWHIRRRQAR